VQEADHPHEIEKAEKKGRKAASGFGEIGEIAISPFLGKG